MEVPIFLKLRMLWNGPLRNLATQPVSWPVKIETALLICLSKNELFFVASGSRYTSIIMRNYGDLPVHEKTSITLSFTVVTLFRSCHCFVLLHLRRFPVKHYHSNSFCEIAKCLFVLSRAKNSGRQLCPYQQSVKKMRKK
jgi:hypothetical protein